MLTWGLLKYKNAHIYISKLMQNMMKYSFLNSILLINRFSNLRDQIIKHELKERMDTKALWISLTTLYIKYKPCFSHNTDIILLCVLKMDMYFVSMVTTFLTKYETNDTIYELYNRYIVNHTSKVTQWKKLPCNNNWAYNYYI